MCPPLSDNSTGSARGARSCRCEVAHRCSPLGSIPRHPSLLRPLGSGVVSDISDDELLGLSEFALLPENAEQAGVTGPLPAVRRVDAGEISALKWGEATPRVVFLHGGGQNAHTWDTVIVGLGVPALAVDLPGHGHSEWREDGDYSPQNNAAAIKPVIE